MPTDANLAVIQGAFADFQTGNIPALIERLSDDVSWTTNYPPEIVPHGGSYSGKAAVVTFFERLGASTDFSKFDPYEFISTGDRVVALVAMTATPRATGISVSTESAMVFRVRDGKLSEFREYGDSLAIVAAYAPGAQAVAGRG
jgi:ketosteroid isomerase-like protein